METKDPLSHAKHEMGRSVRPFQRCPRLLCRKASRHTQETCLIEDSMCCNDRNSLKVANFVSLRGN